MTILISLCLALIFSLVFGETLKKNPIPFYISSGIIAVFAAATVWSGIKFPEFVDKWILAILVKGGLAGAFFIIVMYAGAFPNRSLGAKTFMPIRGQLSIIASILGLGHGLAYLPGYLKLVKQCALDLKIHILLFFVVSVIAIAIMIPLFVTSFVKIRRKMTGSSWKKLQRFAYGFYLFLFIHVLMVMIPRVQRGQQEAVISTAVYCCIFISYFACRIIKSLSKKSMEKIPVRQMIAIPLSVVISVVSVVTLADNYEAETKGYSEESIEVASDGSLKDGTFYGEGMGNNGTIGVELTIKNGEISDIAITKFIDDVEYFDKETDGKEMISRVLEAQSADVDTIAGATFSSEGFISAVEAALQQAGQ